MTEQERRISYALKAEIETIKPDLRSSILRDLQMEKPVPLRQRNKAWKGKLAYGAASIILAFVLTINFFPSAAIALSGIPILDKIVWYTIVDKGILNALEQGYSTTVGITSTDQNVAITAEEVIQGNQISLLVSLDFSDESLESPNRSFSISYRATDQDGNNLSAFSSAEPSYSEADGVYLYYERLNRESGGSFDEIDRIDLNITRITFDDGTVIEGDWNLSVPIQQTGDTEQTIWQRDLNVEVTKENGSSFTIEKIVVTPSETAVYVKIRTEDNIRQTVPDSLVLLDGEGNRFSMSYAYGEAAGDTMELKYYVTDLTYPNIPIKLYYGDGGTETELDLS